MLDWAKFKSAVHYICDKASSDPSVLGAIKLNKVLWYSDLINYLITGKPITGETYIEKTEMSTYEKTPLWSSSHPVS